MLTCFALFAPKCKPSGEKYWAVFFKLIEGLKEIKEASSHHKMVMLPYLKFFGFVCLLLFFWALRWLRKDLKTVIFVREA